MKVRHGITKTEHDFPDRYANFLLTSRPDIWTQVTPKKTKSRKPTSKTASLGATPPTKEQ